METARIDLSFEASYFEVIKNISGYSKANVIK